MATTVSPKASDSATVGDASAHPLAVPAQPSNRRFAPRALQPLVRNRLVLLGISTLVVMMVLAIFADVIAPYDPIEVRMAQSLRPPSAEHWFGTDRFGRDILSRTIHGARISLSIGLSSIGAALIVGTVLGLIAGYFGGWADLIISRFLDILFSFPGLLLAIAVTAMLGPGLINALIAIAVVYTPLFARVVRGQVLGERGKEYVEAARTVGASHGRIIRLHLLPNVASAMIVQASLTLSLAILIESSLSFLGLGAQPPTPTWGNMLSEGRTFLEFAPWMSIFPGIAIMLAVLGFNLLGDGLRDVLDPQMRGES